jgi:hypothetical protein
MGVDVTKMIEPAKQLMEPVAATLSDTWAALIGDRVAAWRLKNAAALQIKVNEEVEKLGLQLDRSKIPERYAFAWFEEATKQDEPEIQELFARLLARAAAGDGDAGDRRNLEIVTHLTPMDAQVMNWMFANLMIPPGYASAEEYLTTHRLRSEFGPASSLSLEHLVTLGVFERVYSLKGDTWGLSSKIGSSARLDSIAKDVLKRFSVKAELAITARGKSLRNACYLPTDDDQAPA